jgi:hypothetical protein
MRYQLTYDDWAAIKLFLPNKLHSTHSTWFMKKRKSAAL